MIVCKKLIYFKRFYKGLNKILKKDKKKILKNF